MIWWWRGNGLWIAFFAFGPAVAMGKLGATRVGLAYAMSAVLLFLIRDWIGRDSALFSIPTRFWPPLVLLIALLVQFSPSKDPEVSNTQKSVAELQRSVPRTLGDRIRIDRIDFDGSSTLNYYATAIVPFDLDDAGKADIARQVRKHYCETEKAIWQANINIAFKISVPPKSLSDRVSSYSENFSAKECQPATR